jgi:tRNA(fMet)-specific endonuclease VapC
VRYLLDTNVCARYLNGKSPAIRQRLRSTNVKDIAVCSVVKAELFYGAMKSNDPERTLPGFLTGEKKILGLVRFRIT